MRRLTVVLGAVGPLLLSAAPALAQCAMCQTALLNSPEGRGMGEEFNRAILVMLFAPYAVFGVVGAVLLRHHIRQSLLRWRRGLRTHLPSAPRVH
jgi:hypothetical protein